ncbi:MAG: hypothetical protein JWN79_148 [Gemmatimonadetes bacterium]|jgi:hypothetical protein|nr:hypothetical protein [Gemmatimonadota bacterium]
MSLRRFFTRQHACVPIAVLLAGLGLTGARVAGAQRTDSARVSPRPVTYDTATRVIPRPPLSPRRAFLYSLALPGYAQSILGRPTAGAIFAVAEAIGIAMLRESNAELRQARRLRQDSLVVIGYDQNGAAIRSPSTYNDELINLRRGHREDWVAALVANHFFAGADAYVAANLWDLPAQVAVKQTDRGTVVAARLRF